MSAIEQQQYDVIATPLSKNYSGGGTVRILFYYDEDGCLQNVDKDVFLSSKCWVINDYVSQVEEKFGQDGQEIVFKLPAITRTNNPSDSLISQENFVEWCCTSGKRAAPVGHDLIRILDCELPDKNTGIVEFNDEILPRGIYFISNKGSVYGPFEITIDIAGGQRRYIASVYNTPSISISTHHISQVAIEDLRSSNLVRTTYIDNTPYSFVAGLKNYGKSMKDRWTAIDYISAAQLMKFISDLRLKNSNKRLMSTSTLSQVKQDLELILKERQSHIQDAERYRRAITLLSLDKEHKDTWFDALNAFLKSDSGENAMRAYLIESKVQDVSQSIKDIEEQFKKKKSDLSQIESALQNKKSDLDVVIKDIEINKNRLSQTKEEVEEITKTQNALLKKETIEIQSEIESLKKEHSDLLARYSKYKDLADIEEELKMQERLKDRLKTTVDSLTKTLQDPGTMINKLTEVHSVMDILGYANHSPKSDIKRTAYQPNKILNVDGPERKIALDLIHTITHQISNEGGRELTEYEVANLLICMQQNFITILQGKPGTGKTSSIINLAKSLKLHNSDEQKCVEFLNIPVARGWTGTRDLLGFYNGLRGVFQPSKTGLFEFLLNNESAGYSSSTRLVLLDEANLSPIEHYWSDFIGLCDKEGAGRSIDTGAQTEMSALHPAKYNSLRFLATINNDSTTEPLSPRLISRAPIISMDKVPHNDDGPLEGTLIELDGSPSANLMESLFGRSSKIVTENRGEDLYEELQKIILNSAQMPPTLRDSLSLEARKQQTVIKYLEVAGEILPDSVAQDFALSQFILPNLKGDGPLFREAIVMMISQSKNNNLERSASILERILNEGDNYLQSYSFL